MSGLAATAPGMTPGRGALELPVTRAPLLVRLTLPRLDKGLLSRFEHDRADRSAIMGRLRCTPAERAFAKELLTRQPRLWLFRALQGAGCGDFVVVDMASPAPACRKAFLVELKATGRTRLGGQGPQVSRARDAVTALGGLVAADTACLVVTGDADSVVELLARRTRRRRRPRRRAEDEGRLMCDDAAPAEVCPR